MLTDTESFIRPLHMIEWLWFFPSHMFCYLNNINQQVFLETSSTAVQTHTELNCHIHAYSSGISVAVWARIFMNTEYSTLHSAIRTDALNKTLFYFHRCSSGPSGFLPMGTITAMTCVLVCTWLAVCSVHCVKMFLFKGIFCSGTSRCFRSIIIQCI